MIMQTRNISFYEKHVRQMFYTEKENEAVIFKMLHQNFPVIPDTKALLDHLFFYFITLSRRQGQNKIQDT